MKSGKMLLLAGAFAAAAMMVAPTSVRAESYDPDDSDYPLRYVAYGFHAVFKGVEYTVTRPIHALVSQPKMRTIFGKTSNPKTDNYWGGWNQYEKSNY
ncbi:MAG: hypothetical protein K1X53_02005 [Candidatus Sumerlaeaceae bacterium]|nr:hypothetical protein [Candidatus Sumerlaeaceae bacterium]